MGSGFWWSWEERVEAGRIAGGYCNQGKKDEDSHWGGSSGNKEGLRDMGSALEVESTGLADRLGPVRALGWFILAN